MAANTLGGLRRELDHDGCAYGQVSREQRSHVVDAVEIMGRTWRYGSTPVDTRDWVPGDQGRRDTG